MKQKIIIIVDEDCVFSVLVTFIPRIGELIVYKNKKYKITLIVRDYDKGEIRVHANPQ